MKERKEEEEKEERIHLYSVHFIHKSILLVLLGCRRPLGRSLQVGGGGSGVIPNTSTGGLNSTAGAPAAQPDADARPKGTQNWGRGAGILSRRPQGARLGSEVRGCDPPPPAEPPPQDPGQAVCALSVASFIATR